MILGHSCKVNSHSTTRIQKESYAQYQEVVDCEEFHQAMELAHRQLNDGVDVMERNLYQEEFRLPLKRNLFGLYSIPVQINHRICHFIVDTGAQISGIKERLANDFKLVKTKGSLPIGSIGGTQKQMKGVRIDSFQIGALEYRNTALVELSEDDFSIRFGNIDFLHFDGILGWDVLSTLDFEMDDIKKEFIVVKNRLRISHPNMIKGSFPCLLMTQPNGNISLYGFDSGSKVSWIGEEAISRQGYHIVGETSSLGFGVHGLEKLKMKVVEECTLYLDKARIDLTLTMSGRTKLFPSFTFDGVLGNEIFKGRRIRILNSVGMVLLA